MRAGHTTMPHLAVTVAVLALHFFADHMRVHALPVSLSKAAAHEHAHAHRNDAKSGPIPGVTFHVDIDDGGSPFPHVSTSPYPPLISHVAISHNKP